MDVEWVKSVPCVGRGPRAVAYSPFFRLDKLELYSGQSLVFLSNICLTLKYHDIQIFWMKQGAWTNSGQTMDFSESKDCPSLIRLQGDQVANKKNIESQL